ncbi:jouberin isoform X2 [Halyomorpha halys]|uniref:jouberin isoform X2 n=1 Tax=Halyomorpha halys TaxID=286706 RepID=UPI0006D50B34|nr:jouberin-like isoform X2 [Halyomorpha halys]
MAVPNPLPRRKSQGNAFASDSTDQEGSFSRPQSNSAIQFVHQVEVHTSVGSNSASSENSLAADKKKKRLRRKSTFSISKKKIQKSEESLNNVGDIEMHNINESDGENQKNGNETFSDRSSSPSSNKIKLIPLLDSNKKKKPSGYATETLSDESESEQHFVKPSVPPRSKIPIKRSENNNNNNSANTTPILDFKKSEVDGTSKNDEIENNLPDVSYNSPPLPFPRKTLNKSVENLLLAENNKSIQGSPQSYCTSSSLEYRDTGTLPKQRLKKHKKKKKLKDSNSEDTIQDSHVDKNDTVSEKSSPVINKVVKSPKKIHRCEPLQIKDLTTKPFVRVMIMDIESGKQKVNSKGEAIESVATQPYDYTFQRSSTPRWEEDLIILEPLDVLKNPSTILLINILDEEKNKVLAWGFLKLIGANGATNIGKQLRLQLLKPPSKSLKDNLSSQMFTWWKNGGYKNYKSTLFVTVNGIPESIVVQNNVGESSKAVLKITTPEKSVVQVSSEKEDRDLEDVRWGRLPSLSCKLPNKYLAKLPAGPDGSLAIAYSHSGLFLASANKVSLCVYTFRGRLHLSCKGHHGLVYSLKWSFNDKYLLSVSADTYACVWDISNKSVTPIQSVSHPSYVYSCAWLDNNTFVTGCFDNDIRIWKVGATKVYQQASHHKGKINALLSYDNYLISGDSVGEICIWNWNPGGNLEFERALAIREIKGKVINKLSLHPGKKRLLVHTRDSVLRMVDISTGSVLHWFQGLVNTKLREDSTFCGCGSLVLAWSEDSTLCAWDSNTSAQAAIYPNLIPDSQPGVVDFHPRDHMMAVSAHSSITPVLSILVYDRLSNGREVGLVPLTGGISSISLNSDRSSGHSSDRSSESTPKKKEGLLKILLGSKKKTKKENSNQPFTENSFTDFSRLSSGVSRQIDFTDTAPKESRLGDIIKRMDKILTSVSNNSSLYTS